MCCILLFVIGLCQWAVESAHSAFPGYGSMMYLERQNLRWIHQPPFGDCSLSVPISTSTSVIKSPQVITCALQHLLAKGNEFTVEVGPHEEYNLVVWADDTDNDVAILQAQGRNAPWIPLVLGHPDALEVGQDVVAIGFPGGAPLYNLCLRCQLMMSTLDVFGTRHGVIQMANL
jgi:hypothetical protein